MTLLDVEHLRKLTVRGEHRNRVRKLKKEREEKLNKERWVSRQFSEITKQGAKAIKKAAREGARGVVVFHDFDWSESCFSDMPERHRIVDKLIRFYEKQGFKVDFDPVWTETTAFLGVSW